MEDYSTHIFCLKMFCQNTCNARGGGGGGGGSLYFVWFRRAAGGGWGGTPYILDGSDVPLE